MGQRNCCWRTTGKKLWQSVDTNSGFYSPARWQSEGGDYILTVYESGTGKPGITCLDAETGETVWFHAMYPRARGGLTIHGDLWRLAILALMEKIRAMTGSSLLASLPRE